MHNNTRVKCSECKWLHNNGECIVPIPHWVEDYLMDAAHFGNPCEIDDQDELIWCSCFQEKAN